MTKKSIVIVFLTLLCFLPVSAEEFTLQVPFSEGKEALESGEYPKAIESFRKVLFV